MAAGSTAQWSYKWKDDAAMTQRIEDYALIGDCKSAALVGRDGSIDWLCWPRFDSPACFAALLGNSENGRWLIRPRQAVVETKRSYRPGTIVLDTVFRSSHGATVPWVARLDDCALSAIAGPERLVLRTKVALKGEDLKTIGTFSVEEGQSETFVLSYGLSFRNPPPVVDAFDALHRTEEFWRDWSDRCPEVGPWTDAVKRSLITLKALTYAPSGGIVAAATTSLPELIGGVRNWDYRYCWLRDATFTLLALMHLGYYDEARDWHNWLLRAVAGSPEQMQILYGVGGERWLPELTIPWLSGYEKSSPVRVGNDAYQQMQLDVIGELADAMFQARKGGIANTDRGNALRPVVLKYLASIWRNPDEGIWEVRGVPQHFVHSKVMAWVAFDRAA
jgi:GH15 family glucan-1,4-alpha-glucosidase